jgi:hypothetical protein
MLAPRIAGTIGPSLHSPGSNRVKFFLILVLVGMIGGAVLHLLERRQPSEAQLLSLTKELNKKLPIAGEALRVEHVEYENRKLTFTGKVVEGQILNEDWNAKARSQFIAFVCSQAEFRKANLTFAYAFDQVALRNLNDKLKKETFAGEVHSADCKR